ncbi:MAG: NAD(P)/FAD-dependent oxidoreductase [Defluviitaleaceae bacterium]|nr:NAD(P)/FAD-dependent oxidoreductase [Defluviitaleaceae bacterium]
MYDIIIIGGGIIGCATARELSRYDFNILLVERGTDIACGATKANSGILHAGYDCHPGTLKAALNVQGAAMYPDLCKELDIPYHINGSMVIGTNEKDFSRLQALYKQGLENGVKDMELLSREEVLALEPNLTGHVTAALRAKTAGVISPYEAGIAFGENAAQNGVEFLLETEVIRVETDAGRGYIVHTAGGRCAPLCGKVIINAAGIESANIHNHISSHKEAIIPQRGQYFLLDNTQKDLVKHTIFPLPSHLGKGSLIVPTVDGNILLGPTAEEPESPTATGTTAEGLKNALDKVSILLKSVPIYDCITAYAGIRAKHKDKDFVIEEVAPGFINAMGIDSPGLSAAPAIAARIVEIVTSRLQPNLNHNFKAQRIGKKSFRDLSQTEQAALIKENPAYGRVVCRCETITEAEIIDAIHRPLGARNLDAIKRRTRAQMGRCQGGFCKLRLVELLSQELGIPPAAVTMDGPGSELMPIQL